MDTSVVQALVAVLLEIKTRVDDVKGLKEDGVEIQAKVDKTARVLQRALAGVDTSNADYIEEVIVELEATAKKVLLIVKKAGKKSSLSLFFKAGKLRAKLKDAMKGFEDCIAALTATLTAHNVGITAQGLEELKGLRADLANLQLPVLRLQEEQACAIQHKTQQLAVAQLPGTDPVVLTQQLQATLKESLPQEQQALLHNKQELETAIKELQAQVAEHVALKEQQEQHFMEQMITALSLLSYEVPAAAESQPTAPVPLAVTIPNAFLCPITRQMMCDPVTTVAGDSYERAAITKWLAAGHPDPMTRHPLKAKDLRANRALKDSIQEWCIAVGHELPPQPQDGLECITDVTTDYGVLIVADSDKDVPDTIATKEVAQGHIEAPSNKQASAPPGPEQQSLPNDAQPVKNLSLVLPAKNWHTHIEGEFEIIILEHLGDEGACAVAAAIADNVDLMKLKVASCRIGDGGMIALAAALANNCSIEELDLRINNFGVKGFAALGEALITNSALTDLNLSYNNIDENNAAALASGLEQNTTLQKLNLTRCKICNGGAKALSKALVSNTSLQELNLECNNIAALGCKAISAALASNTTLLVLNLNNNSTKAVGGKDLGILLKANHTLQALHLSGNSVGDQGAKLIAAGLPDNKGLQLLDLSDNGLSNVGVTAIANVLKSTSSLITLLLSYNKPAADGIRAMAAALSSSSCMLQTLALENCSIDNEQCYILLESLKENKTLQHLNVRANGISDEKMGMPVIVCKSLKTLDLRGNPIQRLRQLEQDAEQDEKQGKEQGGPEILLSDDTETQRIQGLMCQPCDSIDSEVTVSSVVVADALTSALGKSPAVDAALQTLYVDTRMLFKGHYTSLYDLLTLPRHLQTLQLLTGDARDECIEELSIALANNNSLRHLKLGSYCSEAACIPISGLTMMANLHKLELGQLPVEAALPFASWLSTHQQLQDLQFYCCSLDPATSESFGQALAINTSLTHLEFDDNGLKHVVQAIGKALSTNSTLMSLELYSGGTPSPADVLFDGLAANNSLKRLHLHSCYMTDVHLLVTAVAKNSSLQTMNLWNCSVADEGAIALAEALRINHTLTGLNLHRNNIGCAGGVALFNALEADSSLTSLDLSLNKLGPGCLAAQCDSLASNSTLKCLSLGRASLGNEDAAAVGRLLMSARHFKDINLRENNIDAEGAAQLAAGLAANTTLETLELSHNRIACKGATAIAEALSTHGSLHTLNLSRCGVGDEGAAALAAMLATNSQLHTLSLCGNNISDQGAIAIGAALARNKVLKCLDFSCNYMIHDDGVVAIAEGFSANKALVELHLSSNLTDVSALALALAEALDRNTTLKKLHLDSDLCKHACLTRHKERIEV